MNGLDVFLIILIVIGVLVGFGLCISMAADDCIGLGIGVLVMCLFFAGIFVLPFIVLDRGSGSTMGEITSVDKNFFGTTAVYVKTSETTQEEYCVEDSKVAEKAKELIGKKVKISYGERVGLYSTGRCNQAPISKIEVITE